MQDTSAASSPPCPVVCAVERAGRWTALGLDTTPHPPSTGFYLEDAREGLTLQRVGVADQGHGLRLDLLDAEIQRRIASGRRSPLARAIGLRRHPGSCLLDTTCGLGRDSATLAALGARITALERHPVLYALLDDALARARRDADTPAWLDNWTTLIHADANRWLDNEPTTSSFEVIYIDPMFAATRRKAAPQKALAWLNALVGVDTDAHRLLELARARATRQVVVKQHARAEPLAPPDRQVEARAVRFDIYLAGG